MWSGLGRVRELWSGGSGRGRRGFWKGGQKGRRGLIEVLQGQDLYAGNGRRDYVVTVLRDVDCRCCLQELCTTYGKAYRAREKDALATIGAATPIWQQSMETDSPRTSDTNSKLRL